MRHSLKKLLLIGAIGAGITALIDCAQKSSSPNLSDPSSISGHLEFSGSVNKAEDFGATATKKVACMSYPSRSYITLITLGSEESRSISEQLIVNFASTEFPQGHIKLDERSVAFRTIKSSYWNDKENCQITVSHNGVKLSAALKCALGNAQGEQISVSASVDCIIFR